MMLKFFPATVVAAAGVVLGAIAYFAPFENTGVDGSIGALLALVGAAATVGGLAVAMLAQLPTGLRRGLHALIALAAALTAVAAWFLLQPIFAVVMALALLAFVFALLYTSRRRAV